MNDLSTGKAARLDAILMMLYLVYIEEVELSVIKAETRIIFFT